MVILLLAANNMISAMSMTGSDLSIQTRVYKFVKSLFLSTHDVVTARESKIENKKVCDVM